MRVNVDLWEKVFRRDNGYCRYCGLDLLQSYSTFTSATVDHLIAVSAGGLDEPDNLVLACPGCNQMLSRAALLRGFEERKALLVKRWRERDIWYRPLLRDLRSGRPSA